MNILRINVIENIVGSFLVLKLETKWRLFECFEVKQKTMTLLNTLLKKNLQNNIRIHIKGHLNYNIINNRISRPSRK